MFRCSSPSPCSSQSSAGLAAACAISSEDKARLKYSTSSSGPAYGDRQLPSVYVALPTQLPLWPPRKSLALFCPDQRATAPEGAAACAAPAASAPAATTAT